MGSHFDSQNRPWSFKGLERATITLMFFSALCFMNLLGEKGEKHRIRLDISGSQLTVIWVPATRLQSQVLLLFTNHLWRSKRGKRFWAESSVVRGPQDHAGQDETRAIPCFLALSVPWNFHPWGQAHIESLVVTLAPDSPGDNQFVYTILSPAALWQPQSPFWGGWDGSSVTLYKC